MARTERREAVQPAGAGRREAAGRGGGWGDWPAMFEALARPGAAAAAAGGLLLVGLLSAALLVLQPLWPYSGRGRDPWIYYGLFRAAPDLVARLRDLYYASRLSVIAPGWIACQLLPPTAAKWALHLALYGAALGSFYTVARLVFGRRAAALAAIALGWSPYFLLAVGRDYVDGFGIAYFLLALRLLTTATTWRGRPGRRGWRWRLALAGALGCAMVSANLFYVILLPFLAAYYTVVNRRLGARAGKEGGQEAPVVEQGSGAAVERESGGRPAWSGARVPADAPLPLLASAWLAGGGAVAMAAAFALLSKAWGGHYLYVRSSLSFLERFVQTPSIFVHPMAVWIGGARWLVFPALMVAASAGWLWRERRALGKKWREGGLDLFVQLQVVVFCLAMLLLQLLEAHSPTLEYPFYASLMLPIVYLGFAGLLAEWVERLPARVLAVAGGGFVLAQAAVLGLPRWIAMPFVAPPARMLFALGAGLIAAALLVRRPAGMAAAVGVILGLALAQLPTGDSPGSGKGRGRWEADRRGLFLAVESAFTALRGFDPRMRDVRLWYDGKEGSGPFYDVFASTMAVCPGLLSERFPELPGTTCDGAPIVPGMKIALLSERADAEAAAAAALGKIGLASRVVGRWQRQAPSRTVHMSFFETGPVGGAAGAAGVLGAPSANGAAR
ncbi:MAG TPA: hypothetical protein VHR45_20710 [Thermoanaerobaculia bacterium]|nr:hypothetical protein [Thermoanaerobaculia bacterium]